MPFRTPSFLRRGAAPAPAPAPAAAAPAALPRQADEDDDAALDVSMLDAAPAAGGGDGGAGRADSDAHAAALAADVLPDAAAIGSALGGLGAPPLFPLLPREELLTDEERAVSLQGFGNYGCKHYHRRARLVVPCCKGEAFWCRHCHNEAKSGPECAETDARRWHELDRKCVGRVQCALCHTEQAVADACCACGTSFGRYSCLECRFFDDDVRKGQFHCDKCGICRVGGRDNFFHCDTCGCCYSVSIKQGHKCVERSMHSNCPVCFEFLFDSIRAISVMRCGHTIHEHCFQQLFAHHQYTCPTCSKSVCDMTAVWARRDADIAATPMPPELGAVAVPMLCNDCGARGTVPFHVLGLKCGPCGSYNTRR